MKPDQTDKLLADMDACLSETPPVTCWKCGHAAGEPSVCGPCKETMDRYEAPPKGTIREPWKAGS